MRLWPDPSARSSEVRSKADGSSEILSPRQTHPLSFIGRVKLQEEIDGQLMGNGLVGLQFNQ